MKMKKKNDLNPLFFKQLKIIIKLWNVSDVVICVNTIIIEINLK